MDLKLTNLEAVALMNALQHYQKYMESIMSLFTLQR